MSTFSLPVLTLGAAITNNEGFGTPAAQTITVDNNPGALMTNGQFNSYPSLEAGTNALLTQAQAMLSGSDPLYPPSLTVARAAALYTGNGPNAGTNWSETLGVSPDTTLGQIAQGSGTPSSGSSIWSKVWGTLMNMPGVTASGIPGVTSAPQTPSVPHIDFERVIAGIVGLILIAAGVFMFKQTQTVINTVSRISEATIV